MCVCVQGGVTERRMYMCKGNIIAGNVCTKDAETKHEAKISESERTLLGTQNRDK